MIFRKYITREQAKEMWPDHRNPPRIDEPLKVIVVPENLRNLLKLNVKKVMMQLAEKAIDDELSIPKT